MQKVITKHIGNLIEALGEKADEMIDANHSEVIRKFNQLESSQTLINTVALLIAAQEKDDAREHTCTN